MSTLSHDGPIFDSGIDEEDNVYPILPDDAIRLMRILPSSTPDDIQCRLEVHPSYWNCDLQYTALSYCWGDSDIMQEIMIDCKAFGSPAISGTRWV